MKNLKLLVPFLVLAILYIWSDNIVPIRVVIFISAVSWALMLGFYFVDTCVDKMSFSIWFHREVLNDEFRYIPCGAMILINVLLWCGVLLSVILGECK